MNRFSGKYFVTGATHTYNVQVDGQVVGSFREVGVAEVDAQHLYQNNQTNLNFLRVRASRTGYAKGPQALDQLARGSTRTVSGSAKQSLLLLEGFQAGPAAGHALPSGAGRSARKDITITVYDQSGKEQRKWRVNGALVLDRKPERSSPKSGHSPQHSGFRSSAGPSQQSGVAIEELTLAHEGLKLER